MSLPSPAVTMPCTTRELQDVVYQVNRRFQEIEQLLGSVAVDATIPDRSLANVKLILGTITDAEIANGTITATKLNISGLADITKAAGTLTSGTIQNFTITTPTITGGTWSGGTLSTAVITGEFTGKAIITSAGSEVGPFNVSAAKLYTGTVEHNGSQSYFGTGNDIAILDATDGSYRLAIGNASYSSAPFRVTKAGQLIVTGPSITGASINTSTISNGSISGASISNCSVAATVLTVDASSSVNIGAGTEIIWAGDTQLYRASAGNLKTDTSFVATGVVSGTTGLIAGTLGSTSFIAVPGVGNVIAQGMDVTVYTAAGVEKCRIAQSTGTITTVGGISATGAIVSSGSVAGTGFQTGSSVWSPGAITTATVALDTANYLALNVNGVPYKIGLVT